MNAHLTVRGRRLALATALTACVIPIGAAMAAQAQTGSPGATVSMAGTAKAQTVRYGKTVSIAGRVAPGGSGRAVRLEHAAGKGGYRQVAASRTAADGSYNFTLRPQSSGSYRAVADGAATSAARRITVVASVAGRSARHVLGTRPVRVRGKLLPAQAGRRVKLQVLTRGGWRTVDRERTGPRGRFRASFKPRRAGAYRLRVRFAGDRLAAAASDRLAKVRVYRPGHASWYGPGLYGNPLGCGGRSPRARSEWRTSRCRVAPGSRSATAAGR